MTLLSTVGCAAILAASASPAAAQAPQPLINLCTGLSVTLPVLQPVAGVASGVLAGVLDPALNTIVGGVNTNLTGVLSGRSLGVTAIDQNGNLVTFPSNNCNVGANNFTIQGPTGITVGGGRIDGLGGTANPSATAGEVNSIALGNGATTSTPATSAVALGLRGTVTAADGVALGRDANVSATGGVALGAASVANRAGLAGGTEAFSGNAVASTRGAVSVGAAGAERQIANVAGGTAATDAVNLRQLRAVGTNLATSLGGGAGFDATTGAFTAPTYTIGGTAYTNVGGALNAVDASLATNRTNITNLQTSITNGTIGLLQQNPISRTLTVGASTNGALVDISGTAGTRRVTGVAAGAGSTDAVNVTQLNSAIAGIGAGSPTVASENSGGAAPPVATGLRSVAVGYGSAATAADTFSVGAIGAERRIVNAAPGIVAAGSTDAVNGAQLFATNNAVTTNAGDVTQLYNRLSASLGGGAAYDPTTKAYTFPSYTIRGSSYNSVGDAFAAVDTALGNLGGGGGGGGSAPIRANSVNAATQPIATGDNSVAAGLDARATGNASSAVGNASISIGQSASSFGASSAASGANSTAIGSASAALASGSSAVGENSQARALNTTAIGMNSFADFEGSTAIGAGARAIADPTTAVGYQALASGDNAVAVGANSTATGLEASSIGAFAQASGAYSSAIGRQAGATGANSTALGDSALAAGDNATALGRQASAGGLDSTALGVASSAAGENAIAVGERSSAGQVNAIAIGVGVQTTRANQVAIGNGQSTYTLAGIGSAASAAAQSGPTRVVTADAAGNLATSNFDPNAIGSQMGALARFATEARTEARRGISAAMAMTAAPMPSAAGRTSWSMNTASFQGEWAGGVGLAHRLDVVIPIAVTASYGISGGNSYGVRVGLAGEF